MSEDNRKEPLNPFLRHLSMYLTEIGRDRKWLSKVTGVNHNTLNAMFTFNRWPRLDMAQQIADGLDLPIDYFMTGKERSVNLSKDMEELVDMLSGLNTEEMRELRAAIQMWFILRNQRR